MAELVAKLEELQRLPPELHWFCNSYNPTSTRPSNPKCLKTEHPIGDNVQLRREQAAECLTIYSYDDALRYQVELGKAIDSQLGRCDVCVVEYYKAKQRLVERLRLDYDEEVIIVLEKSFDKRDINRIKDGLDRVTQKLKATDAAVRSKNVLELSDQLALFEALSSKAFLGDEDLLVQHFQEPFTLVQTNKRLRIPHYVPAATTFLFDTNHDRWNWATHAWSKYRDVPTKDDFDFAIRDQLLHNMKRNFQFVVDAMSLERLWQGIGLIVDKLDNDLVTHSLRAMEIDVFMLALDHLKYDTLGFRYLVRTIQKLLEIAPKDFWDSMGPISPTTFIEQIFNNAQYDRFMEQAKGSNDQESSPFEDMLSWIKPFMASLDTVHQARACRSLAFQLLDRLQVDRFPVHARVECFRMGLATIAWTLKNCNKDGNTLTQIGRVVAAETLEVASQYIKKILNVPSLAAEDKFHESCAESCLLIVRIALALECKSLRTDQEALNQRKELPNGYNSYSPAIWDAVVQNMDRGNIAVARSALIGINDLTGLEKFKMNADETYTKEKGGFNVKLGRLTHLVCQILERINDFSPDDLDKLFRNSDTATALVASLFSPDASLYEAGVNLIKSISYESARKEAIGHLLRTFLPTTLNAFSWSIRRIARNRTYASCPRMLKTSSDVLDILCDSQDGLLRTRALSGTPEIKAIENFWQHQWEGLRIVYEMTEDWGRSRVADSSVLKEFCRDTMQFSERYFDQYSIFANAIDSAITIKCEDGISTDNNDQAGKELLKHPAAILEAMVKWLRLRDLFLVEIAVKLTKKVLDRLTELKMTVAEGPSKFLDQVINNGPQGRTHLTPQQRAELARALEANLGRTVATANVIDIDSENLTDRSREQSLGPKKNEKPATIDLEKWRSKAKSSGQVIKVTDDDEFVDSDVLDQELLSVSRSIELMKQMKEQQVTLPSSSRQNVGDRKIPVPTRERAINKAPKAGMQTDADRALFREKREKEREAKKKRDAEALAMVKRKAVGIAGQTIGEGSGLGGIGVKGKDHAPKGPSMMVSSGSENDSDDSLDESIFGNAPKPAKVSQAVREYQASKVRHSRIGPIKKTRQVRSAKDMRARLAPDLTSLHKTLLSWDFFHSGDFPPGSDREDYSLVTNTFRTPNDYQNTFEPLLILEAWQGFLKSKEEGNFKAFEIKVANRMTVDAFVEVSTTMSMAEGKELGIGEADIVLMSKGLSPATEKAQPHCLARVYKINRKKVSMEITYRVNVGNGLVTFMVPNTTLNGVKVSSITPLEREYGALLGLKYFDLCDEITRAKPSPLLTYSEKHLGPLVANYDINIAQAKAVRSAIDNDAFTLIQGPPGSGKTKTIVAIVGALMTSSFADKDKGIAISHSTSQHVSLQRNTGIAAKKLLVCAPSNAAVDELVMRFKQGVKTANGEHQKLSVIRLGRSDAINTNVLDVTLDELVNAKMNIAIGKQSGSGEDIQKLMMTHKATCEEFNVLRTKVDEQKAKGKPASPEQDHEFEVLKRRKQQLSNQIDAARDSGNTAARDAEITRRRVQQEVLDGAHVICATLSGSGHEMFQSLNIEFETVVIDEAAQSIELSALIPLKYGCSKCILVGDPKQLPPTVLSREAARFQYEQSLFVRMQANHPHDVHLLDTQYRMHPEISLFPSTAFYDSKLLDGPGMDELRIRPWHESNILGPYRFFDVQGTHQSAPRGHSLINLAEIEVALKLFDRLITDCKTYDFKGKVGIITPYKSQLRELRSRFARTYGDTIFATVEFNTTDAFQGRESEVIIFSCVRASFNRGIGFLSDIRRMNVGITRAKSSLWVLGNSQALTQGEFWNQLVQDAKRRDRYTSGDLTALLSKPSSDPTPQAVFKLLQLPKTSLGTDSDIEMPDAPVLGESATTSSRSDSVMATYSLDNEYPNDASATKYIPSGGGNGFNENANCAICGSFAHYTNRCDNVEAKERSVGRCHRCGEFGHMKNSCTVKRCITCGEIGHTQEVCSSANILSRKDRDRIIKQEMGHRLVLQHAPEKQRKRQLGDHDKRVPVVRATSNTPPPESRKKRKRDPSPPASAPKGPKETNGTRPRLDGPQATGRHQDNLGNPRHVLPPRPPASRKHGKPSQDATIGGPAIPTDPNLPVRPGTSSIIKAGEGSREFPASRGPLLPQNHVRPPRRRKDADPFIRPKCKR